MCVDVERAHKLKRELSQQEALLLEEVKKQTGIDVQIWAARSIAKVFDKLSLTYATTEKTGSPSFTKNFLSTHNNPVIKSIAKAREINKAHTTFIDTILKHYFRGSIHADINPIRSDQGGTVTGRFSYSNPNLQQIPARNKDLGPMIRSLFIPEKDHKWGCFDYSQQEPRLVVHYAATTEPICFDNSVSSIVDKFKDNSVDFHQTVADMANISRTQAKTINLGLFYGMGKAKLQAELGVTKEKAAELFNTYHGRVPFVKQLMERASNRARDRGQIRTLLGRLCRFHLWEPNQFGIHKPLPHDAALAEHGPGIRRAYTYKALNRLIQGSAADMTKKAMVELHKEGITPHIQVHDELDISVESPEHAEKIKDIMYKSKKVIYNNDIGIGVEVYDRQSGNNYNRNGIYEIRMYLDSILNFSYKMDTHFTVMNNQIVIPGHLNYATYQLEGSWTDNYGKLGTIFCNGETKIPKSNLVEIFGICEITDEDRNKRWWTINRDKSEIELGVGRAKQIEGQNIWKTLNNIDCNYAIKHTEGFSYMKINCNIGEKQHVALQ